MRPQNNQTARSVRCHDMPFRRGDIVTTKLHQGCAHLRCEVVRTKTNGQVVIRGRSGRLMTLKIHQLQMVRPETAR